MSPLKIPFLQANLDPSRVSCADAKAFTMSVAVAISRNYTEPDLFLESLADGLTVEMLAALLTLLNKEGGVRRMRSSLNKFTQICASNCIGGSTFATQPNILVQIVLGRADSAKVFKFCLMQF